MEDGLTLSPEMQLTSPSRTLGIASLQGRQNLGMTADGDVSGAGHLREKFLGKLRNSVIKIALSRRRKPRR